MAELEPGHPDELVQTLRNWLNEANSPIGSLPEGTDPVEWAVRRFIASWQGPVRGGIEFIEESLQAALAALEAGDLDKARSEIESARQSIGETVRDHLGLYEWNKD